MAGPGDERAAGAAGRGQFRASHADRERTIEVLKDAFAQGRLTEDELDARAGQVLASRTYADLGAVTADIPPSRPLPGRFRPGRPARPPGRWRKGRGGRGYAFSSRLPWWGSWP